MNEAISQKNKLFAVGILLLFTVLLVACDQSGNQSQQLPAQPEQLEQSSQEDAQPAADEVVDQPEMEIDTELQEPYPDNAEDEGMSESSDAPVEEAYPAPAEKTEVEEDAEQTPKPTPRGDELVATDPSTVSLASGEFQLVELFAFW